MLRLGVQPAEVLKRNQRISFKFDGKDCEAYEGDTIGSALRAFGLNVFSRSFKYHRPRGLLCVSGKCPNCLMNVNGVPNVRVCARPARQGDRVKSQHCWPSLQWDAHALIEKLDFLLPVGFYYKTLIRPRYLWKWADPVIRHMAGAGKIDPHHFGNAHYDHEYLYTDVAIVGGGPAGLSAACAAAEAGASVVLIDDQPQLGGHLRAHQRPFLDPTSNQPRPGFQIADGLASQALNDPRIKVFSSSIAFGGYEDGLLAVATENRLIHLRASQTVVATGCFEYPIFFENNDLPGVMLASGALRLMHLYGVKPGERAIVVTSDDDGLALALDLHRAAIHVVAVVDQRPVLTESPLLEELKNLEIPHLVSCVPLSAQGRGRVQLLRVGRLEAERGTGLSEVRTYPSDLVCLCSNRTPSAEILRHTQGTLRFDPRLNQMVPDRIPANFHVAGHITGIRDLSTIVLEGRIAALEAVHGNAGLASELSGELQRLKAQLKRTGGASCDGVASYGLSPSTGRGKQFVCLCEDVTRKDIEHAVAEGFDEMELLKRYTTASMGPCQGRMCLMSVSLCCANETGCALAETGTTTSRPPIQPVPLGILAGPHHHPIKLTPMHYKHVQANARQMNMGEWIRPHTYTHPELEWKAVRERVGMIDVSTLGKLDVAGRDAARLLDKVYTHVFSSLKVGRTRYGVICGDDGIILDDGTVSRLNDGHFYITTTTGNIEFVEKWLNWWQAGTDLCVHITNVTGDYAAVNVAGPKARDVLKKLTDIDVSQRVFKYMDCAQGEVAGVPALLMRIGFVGETGWEIHFPACFAEYFWDQALTAGREFGIAPFGVEAQRLLRLEKKHVIVGQDTDALSNPLEAGMEWAVKFDKEDFIGKPGLLASRANGLSNKLVGFISDRLVEEGSVVVLNQAPVGRVTSARMSPHQKCCVGMAWVPLALASEGTAFQIRSEGAIVTARTCNQPFYDPAGLRLKG